MFVGGSLWHQQDEQQVDRCAVDGVEVHRGIEVQQGTDGCCTTRQATMGNGNAVAKTGRAEFFAGNEALEHGLRIQFGYLLPDQVGDLFEYTFFTASRHVQERAAGGQDIFKSDHGWGVLASRRTLKVADLLFLML